MKAMWAILSVLVFTVSAHATLIEIVGPEEVVQFEPFEVVIHFQESQVSLGGITGGWYGDLPIDDWGTIGIWQPIIIPWPNESDYGFDFTIGDLVDPYPHDPWEAWIHIDYTAGQAGDTANFDLYDYAISFDQPIETYQVGFIVPEPLSIFLLTGGGIMLLRQTVKRKKSLG